ncbi:hypothetical protein LEP1GSC103_0272 [Leptospira borgpetersenii serovar Javanica str. UI 09931]|uniref:Uncharacterized protein n=1 Tax=Leptospira borgpetersenii serovar Javanica str. UI 09931 TaxID=1049767 RepID=A0AAV3JDX4_LEPBO|nr:hypothetical protein LEP1GSC101_2675 [Leptospira borgpetersenii str. UI 09149]EKQ99675.1 hypothetical protein LEP1GSC121_1966 [Leptospira borgpetersenii serovar Castellonis str. 200801910]EMN58179.1 hypothetical protein LEP1GSC090_3869 [Leptospira borgpetersenii serovar Javanica str. MK146]EMO09275.1 hypothetical protein LEP1GSC137_2689 [Leptospira borgpetersenii str. Noumea 25]EPG58826.1 hypothetical protein LEP1GSC103_0272 [Leptospira borgpetersenii serovar Javanica str. UI 09931]
METQVQRLPELSECSLWVAFQIANFITQNLLPWKISYFGEY